MGWFLVSRFNLNVKVIVLALVMIIGLCMGKIIRADSIPEKNAINRDNYLRLTAAVGVQKDNSNLKEGVNPGIALKSSYYLDDKGEDILELQKDLNKYGYNIKTDGIYGNSTYFAVINFQEKLGISVDGVIGTDTIKFLEMEPKDNLMYKPITAPVSSIPNIEENYINSENIYSKTDYFIWVDSVNFKVNIFSGTENNWKQIKAMTCSMGASFTPTAKGHFEIGGRGPMFRVNDSIICKYFTQFSGNFLFHSVLLNNNGVPVDGRLGYGISHGCIRLAIEDAKFIFENIPTGTSVWVK